MEVLLFLTSSSPPTPSQSPTRTSGCTGLNNGLSEEKFTGNTKLLLRQERLQHGSQHRRKSRNQMEKCASSGQKCTCITQMCKVPPQIPESWRSTEQPIVTVTWGSLALHLLEWKGKAFVDGLSSKDTVKNFVWSVILVFLCTIFDVFMSLKRVCATFSFANLHHGENKVADNTCRSYARDMHCFSSSA